MWFLLLLGLLAPQGGEPSSVVEPLETTAPAHRADLVAGLGILREWDVRREAAWAASDIGALRALYVPGSGAGRADARLLEAYRARDLVVRRLLTQVFAVQVLDRRPATVRLRVLDRVAGGEVVRHGRAGPLASTRPLLREVVFRRTEGRWKVDEVSGWARGPHAGLP